MMNQTESSYWEPKTLSKILNNWIHNIHFSNSVSLSAVFGPGDSLLNLYWILKDYYTPNLSGPFYLYFTFLTVYPLFLINISPLSTMNLIVETDSSLLWVCTCVWVKQIIEAFYTDSFIIVSMETRHLLMILRFRFIIRMVTYVRWHYLAPKSDSQRGCLFCKQLLCCK